MTNDDRVPPKRIRITGLQEAQLQALVAIEHATAAMYYELGFDAAEVPTRAMPDIVRLTRDHELCVAEADHVVAGWLAWRDEEPGVAYVEECSVHPDFQRFGVGRQLVAALFEGARKAGLHDVTVKCWKKATWAWSFYAKLGFAEIGDAAPAKVVHWRDKHVASGRPLTRPGEVALWIAVPPAAKAPEPEEDEDEPPAADE
jgi:amino-acid N-acetyltransferase